MHQPRNTELKAIDKAIHLLSEFWLWWSGELVDLVPGWIKQSGPASAGKITICFRNNAVSIVRKVKGKDELRVEFPIDDGSELATDSLYQTGDKVKLILADGSYLRKEISLPLAAAENLRGVLEFEMDRHTPFQANQVYFDFQLISKHSDTQQIVVELVAAPRNAIDKLTDTLSRSGIPVNAISLDESKKLPNINLLQEKSENRSRFTFRTRLDNFHIAVLVVTTFLTVATITVPIWQKRADLLRLQPLVEELGGKASGIQSSRRELEKLVSDHNFLVKKKSSRPPSIAVLEELARLLPDDTWIHRVVITGNEIVVVGETDSAATVIRLVEESTHFVNANFQSPLTKSKSGKERFHLATEFSQSADSLADGAAR